MTAKAALAKALLDGRIINIKNCFELIGLTNAPREVSRMIESPITGFGVQISRQHMTGKSRYGQPVTWTNYRLNRDADYNQEGIARMREYVKEQAAEYEKQKASGTKVREHTRSISKPQQPEYTNKLF